MLETYKALTLNTLPLEPEFVTIAVAEVVTARTAVFPVIVVTPTMFGAAMIYPPRYLIADFNKLTLCFKFPIAILHP
jgi:hypothetical protein